jgi:hypothetical protein
MAMLSLQELWSPLKDSDSDRTVIRKDDDCFDAPDLDFLIAGREESLRVPTIWDRPNGIRSVYPQLGNKTYLDHAGTTVRGFPMSKLASLALLTGENGHSFMHFHF